MSVLLRIEGQDKPRQEQRAKKISIKNVFEQAIYIFLLLRLGLCGIREQMKMRRANSSLSGEFELTISVKMASFGPRLSADDCKRRFWSEHSTIFAFCPPHFTDWSQIPNATTMLCIRRELSP